VTTKATEHVPVDFAYLTPEAYLALSGDETLQTLAAIIHGDFDPPPRPWPQVQSRLRPPGGSSCVEVLRTAESPTYATEGGFQVAHGKEILFAARSLRDDEGTSLSSLTDELYAGLLGLVARRGFPHILRMWNLVGAINDEQDGLERYKQFCRSRHGAFAHHGPALGERYPSASAVGTTDGGLCVYLLAARAPGMPVENPKQVSAYRYPSRYGPRSPSFSRALVKAWPGGTQLFLSGTASITGHESRHAGRLAAQAEETLANLRTLIGAAEQASGTVFPLTPHNALLKAYLRRQSDYREVRDLLDRRLGGDIEVLYLEADLCRRELLLEVDGAIFTPAGAM
jgi:chorismate lyase/3-hydroxybenzoate synthase